MAWVKSVLSPFALFLWILGGILIALMPTTFLDHDDVNLLAYHAMGRDLNIQPPYASYQIGFDTWLSLLPSKPLLLFYVSHFFTITAFLFLIYALQRLHQCVFPSLRTSSWLLYAFSLAMLPEVFYLTTTIKPDIFALAMAVTAHLLIRQSIRHTWQQTWIQALCAAWIYALGIAFRLNIATYLLVITTDLFLHWRARTTPWSRTAIIAWISCTIISTLAAIGSMYHFIYHDSPWLILNQDLIFPNSWNNRFVGMLVSRSMITPAYALCVGIGVWIVFKNTIHHHIRRLWIASLIAVSPWILYGNFKTLLVLLPMTFGLCILGLDSLWNHTKAASKAFFIILIILPWVIGFHVNIPGIGFGPNFRIRDKSTSYQDPFWIKPGFHAGLALPTPEGLRPCWGHLYALLQRNALENHNNTILKNALHQSIAQHQPILKNGFHHQKLEMMLLELGFSIIEPIQQISPDVSLRTMTHPRHKKTVHIFQHKHPSVGWSCDDIKPLKDIRQATQPILFIGDEPSRIEQIKKRFNGAFQIFSPMNAWIDVHRACTS